MEKGFGPQQEQWAESRWKGMVRDRDAGQQDT